MLTVDRSQKTPVGEQLVEQLRYLIASGHFKVNETLPSTRKLGDEVGVSFHTVRKAYQQLEEEGILESQVGSGYTVKERSPLGKGERMERGAEVVHDALQRLIGLGLQDAEIEYLFQEQANLLDHASLERKLILAGPHSEINALCADQIASALQRPVRAVPINQLERHTDADFVFTPYPHLGRVMNMVPRADTMGFVTYLPASLLEQVARLMEHETLGLVTRYKDTIPYLTSEIRTHTAFGGQTIAASIEAGTGHLQSFIDQTDRLLYTPASRRRLLPLLEDHPPHASIAPVVSRDSIEAIQRAVPA